MHNLDTNLTSNQNMEQKTSLEELNWCQELATTLDPFNSELLTPRQIQILKNFGWLNMVGHQGYELTQLILQKLHQHAQNDQILHL